MLHRSLVLLTLLLFFGCANPYFESGSNAIVESSFVDGDYFQEFLKYRGSDIDSFGYYNSLDSSGCSVVNFGLDLRGSSSLGKTKIDDMVPFADFRRSKVNIVDIVFTDSLGRSIEFASRVINGQVAPKAIVVPPGFKYFVRVNLYYGLKCPWNKYYLYDCSFSGYDTVDVISKSSDTMSFSFRQSIGMRYFYKVKHPPGKYTEGKYYPVRGIDTLGSTLYQDSCLCFSDYTGNFDFTTEHIRTICDTGEIVFSFFCDLNELMYKDFVEIDGANTVLGDVFADWDFPIKTLNAYYQYGHVIIKYSRSRGVYVRDSLFTLEIRGPKPDTSTNLVSSGSLRNGKGSLIWTSNSPLAKGEYSLKTAGAIDGFYDGYPEEREKYKAPEFVGTFIVP
jgi:hypothetical protein